MRQRRTRREDPLSAYRAERSRFVHACKAARETILCSRSGTAIYAAEIELTYARGRLSLLRRDAAKNRV